ncbi:MAG TPA: DUF2827 family protein [Caulobacteraceae bacterium]|jgi:hypothetical protein
MFVNAGGSLGLFENGLRQNVILLYHLFRAMPGCARVWLLNGGEAELTEDITPYGVDPADVVSLDEVADRLDMVIAAGAALDPAALRRLRDWGCRIIAYKGGNGAVISMEAVVARPMRTDAERYFDADLYDAVWLTPQHWATYRGWCETVYRCPVRQVPQVWSPMFVQQAAGPDFGYRSGQRTWRIGVMDPNITVMKTSHMPMLVCEAAFRARPEVFAAFYVANGQVHRDNAHFASFTTSLTAARAGLLSLEPRFVGAQFLERHCDALVTHQWENALNYLYWETLWGGYPLIHNSPMLEGLGYHYPDFDSEAGAASLLDAHARHDDEASIYQERAWEKIASLAPTSTGMIAAHEALVATC